MVSIITPSFQSEKFIEQTIQSVQNQTYQNWEMIIVDDCSTDNTVLIINRIAETDTRIKYFVLDKNSGTGVARQKGVDEASGRFIAFLDADDLWKPDKLTKQLEFLEQRKLKFTFSFFDCIDEAGNKLHKTIQAPMNLSYSQLFFCNYIGNLTAIYDVDYFGKIPISPIRKRQDWMLWLCILKQIKNAKPVPESLALYRIRQNSISASKIDLIKHNFNVYFKFHRFNLIISIFCMVIFLFTQLILKPRFIIKNKI